MYNVCTNKCFFRANGSVQGGQALLFEEGRTYWGIDSCSHDEVYSCRHRFLRLAPHSAVNICLPDEGCEFW